jgi:cell division protein FtsA
MARSGYDDGLASGVVLTGGSAALQGIADVAEGIFRLPVRIGLPHHVTALEDLVASPAHATAIGLVLAGAQGRGGVRMTPAVPAGVLERARVRVGEWLRDFF